MLKLRFDWSGRCLVAVLAAAALVGCQDATEPHGVAPAAAAYDLASAPTLETFYGPTQFTRTKGAPDLFSQSISTRGYTGPFVLTVQNGATDGSSRVTNGHVTLGGVALLGPSDFSTSASGWSIPVTLGDSATLQVELKGKSGTYLTISLAGMQHARFCPVATGDGFGYQTLQGAIDSVAANHTVWVCDGTHSVDGALLSKPLTLRAENPGQATLAQDPAATGKAAILTVSGIASGMVSITGLTFSYSNIGLYTLDYDSLSVTGTTFAGPTIPPAQTWGVFLDLTPTPPSSALFDHDTFTGGVSGLGQSQPVNIVTTNSNFHDITGYALIYSTANGTSNPAPAGGTAIMRGGRVEYNTFTNCGSGICIGLEQSGADTVRFNSINMPSGSVGDGIFLNRPGQTAALTQPAVITDNVLTGHAPVGDPSIQANWGFRGGIVENNGIPGVIDDVERNQINSAFYGISLRGGGTANFAVSVSAQDNQITNVYVGWVVDQSWNVLTAHRNDISAYVYPITRLLTAKAPIPTAPTLTASALTCNWWGSASGPANMLPGVLVAAYTPFATAPIANTATACTP